MWGPRFAVGWQIMSKNPHAGRSKRGGGVIEETMKVVVCREVWIQAGGAEKVERKFGLWKELIPEVKGEVRVDGA